MVRLSSLLLFVRVQSRWQHAGCACAVVRLVRLFRYFPSVWVNSLRLGVVLPHFPPEYCIVVANFSYACVIFAYSRWFDPPGLPLAPPAGMLSFYMLPCVP